MNLDLDRVLSKEEILERGRRSVALLDDPLIKDALAHITQQALDEFEDADPSDEAKLKSARYLLDATKRFAGIFVGYISEGKALAARDEAEKKEVV